MENPNTTDSIESHGAQKALLETSKWTPSIADIQKIRRGLLRSAEEEEKAAIKAVARYLLRKYRYEHPTGGFDNAGRWYPCKSEGLLTQYHRTPSRQWPYSYLLACRSMEHCAQLEGEATDATLVRSLNLIIGKSDSIWRAMKGCRRRLELDRKKRTTVKIGTADQQSPSAAVMQKEAP